jgi:transcriptional regulator with XRE-family HTH domain
MRTSCGNIYKTCRVIADLTQEKAAEQIAISVRSLADYESGKTIPGDDVVCRMVELYQAPELAYLHLKHSTEVGRRYLPDLCLDELPRAVLRLQKESRELRMVEPDLIEIACDGVVDRRELPAWEKAIVELHDLAGAALAVIFTRKEKRPLQAAR